ncbi:hypothetical protein [Spirosoma foliorum]|uniref:Transposase DDE domain-containing protein n=1 Tax=Spirosoma foliorum TaxID=2710596 RepID=A0A7G5H186_9BACT|nr:hypothetical protein [Spirosoma foliorum]QMW04878.1 hypothetical protein H3H32_08200 [Spirosoma foliorum]
MRRCNARGQSEANKRMLMVAMAYNLKKWLVKKDCPKAVTQVLALKPENLFVYFNLGLWKRFALCNNPGRFKKQLYTFFLTLFTRKVGDGFSIITIHAKKRSV